MFARPYRARARVLPLLALLLALTLPLAAPPAAAAPGATIIDLGVLPGYEVSAKAAAINAAGDVVGTASGGKSQGGYLNHHAFLWRAGTMIDLGTLGGADSYANGINAAGAIVGSSTTVAGDIHAFVWRDGRMTELGTLPGFPQAQATAINTAGQIVGVASTSPSGPYSYRAILWERDGTPRDLGSPPGLPNAYAAAINDDGAVVGGAINSPTSGFRACLWRDGQVIDLSAATGPVANRRSDVAYAINNPGQIVGTFLPADSTFHLFRTPTYAPINPATDDLGTLPGIIQAAIGGINAAGQFVGRVNIGSTATTRPFLYDGAAFIDLRDSLPADSGWTLHDATAINDAGVIVGWGTINGREHPYLLIPAAMPGLPNTGGGGMAHQSPSPLVGIALLGLLGCGLLDVRRALVARRA